MKIKVVTLADGNQHEYAVELEVGDSLLIGAPEEIPALVMIGVQTEPGENYTLSNGAIVDASIAKVSELQKRLAGIETEAEGLYYGIQVLASALGENALRGVLTQKDAEVISLAVTAHSIRKVLDESAAREDSLRSRSL
jgi:hypothetical protein